MLKIYCDICGDEPKDPDFACGMSVRDVKIGIDSRTLVESKREEMFQLHFCRECFVKQISPLIKKN